MPSFAGNSAQQMEFDMQWICDTCGLPIESEADGWFEWLVRQDDGKWIKHSPRLVHVRPVSPRGVGCQYAQDTVHGNGGNIIGDMPLSELTGVDGLITLLSFASDVYFELEQMLQMIMRIQVPDYDLVRGHFEEAIGQVVFEPNTKPGYYDVGDIAAVKRWLNSRT